MIRELPKRDLRGAEDPSEITQTNFLQHCERAADLMENEKSPPQLSSHSSQGSCLVHRKGRAKWKTEIYETRISILRLFSIHRLLSQSAFSCFLLLKSFESELFCIDGTNVRSDILICPPLPFPPCHDDPILNKKRLGAYPKELPRIFGYLHTRLVYGYVYGGGGGSCF